MDWHYILNDETIGPVDENIIKGLLAEGKLNADSMVWNSSMTDWKKLSETSLNNLIGADEALASTLPVGSVRCSVCGKGFSESEVIKIGALNSCAECKPVALKQFQENSQDTGDLRYAGFWIRVGSTIIDSLVLYPINMGIGFMVGISAVQPQPDVAILGANWAIAQFLQIAVAFAYTTLLIWKYGGTLGLLALGLRVTNPDGTQISYPKSIGRYFAYILNGFTFGIGFLMVAFDEQKRALHDRICDTRVIYKKK